jgi:6-pyruvoyltetrahydropterin/6-carboxytetrahydropterin synthase
MFEVGVSASVRAFHTMPGQPPPENERHPHDYRVEVVAERDRLDERGMVCDLDIVTGSVDDLTGRLRDRDLEGVCGTEPVTVEVLASWIHAQLAPTLGRDGAQWLRVRVWESGDAFGGIRAAV